MVIFLPRKNDFHPAELTLDVFKANLPTKTCKLKEISMPKWSLETGMELIGACKQLGIEELFMKVQSLVQMAKIVVDSEGTVAAAVTVAKFIAMGLSFELPRESLIVDRPFFYAILNERTQVIEFLGYLMTPPESVD